MNLSVLDIFKIGVGPSSSHTMGPMNAACAFVRDLESRGLLERTEKVAAQMYGSLALTGSGHCTDRAVLLGLEGRQPATIDPDTMEPTLERIRTTGRIRLAGKKDVPFDEPLDLLFHRDQTLPQHPNGMRFTALDAAGQVVWRDEYFSTGGGFVVRGENFGRESAATTNVQVPHPFTSAQELLAIARDRGLELYELVLENERAFRPDAATRVALLQVWAVMSECIDRGFQGSGVLPGVLKVRRRAARLHRQLTESGEKGPLDALEWVNAFALAVNEENAAGGRVVTAPTNGAAGIVPAVLAYYRKFEPGASEEGVVRFLLVAGAIGMLYKRNASISGAEMGCQGEVGVACSMAAAGLAAALGASNAQVENAAEIGMEHTLHRAQRDGRGEGDQRGTAVVAGRRHAQGLARPGHRDHAPDRARHVDDLQGNEPGRACGERAGMLRRK